jgi:hypothetical protein
MNYTRLIIIIALVLFIAYMNRSVREGLDSDPCPDGQVKIPEADNSCAVPGSTAAPSVAPPCPTGTTFNRNVCVDSTTREFRSLAGECPSGYIQLGSKCWGKCPGEPDPVDGVRRKTCPPRTTPASGSATGPTPTTPAAADPAAPATPPTRTLADVTKDIDYLKSIGLNEGSENDSMKRLVAERASLGGAPPISTPPYSNSPSALANVPTPSMSCAVENFSSF